ncbi:odorant receptor 49b-like isoform X1 [Cydia strobilella]|uniref:odorant receptor 49b-like isoform X1 n=2 Tax=Cydia strobilella TaxID=1100964 RepID=UPI0030041F71
MIKEFLQSLEDPNRPLFGPNYWLLKKLGLLLSKNWIDRIWKIIIHEIALLFVLSQYIELYAIGSNLDHVSTNLRISMLSIVVTLKANTFLFWQRSWRQVIDYITEADKFERHNQDEAKGRIINTYTKYCRRVTYFYWVLALTTSFTNIIAPLTKYCSSEKFREGYHNGTEQFPHILSSWVPFDKDNSPGCWITVMWHIGITYYGGVVSAAYDTSVMVILVCFGGKLDLLRIRCREMLGTEGKGVNDENAEEVVRQLHRTHVLLLKHSRLFNSVLSPVMFCYVVMCSLMICATAVQLTSATSTTQKLLMAEYLIFGIAQLFMFCWHSNDVIYKNQAVLMGPYESDWWAANLQQRKNVLILQGQMRMVHIYTAGPFTNLTLSTFIAILKGAYSFYTIFRK